MKKTTRAFLITSLVCSSTISVACGLASCQEEVACYEIKSNQTFIGRHDGQGDKPLSLYKNGNEYQDKVTWSVIDDDQDGRIKVSEKTNKLVWNNLDSGKHFVKIAAFVNGDKVAENEVKLNVCDEAIYGSRQLKGWYDQAGTSDSYLLLDDFGKNIDNVTWNIEDDASKSIWFQKDKIVWASNLNVGQHDFTIVATKGANSWRTKAYLTIEKDYFITGEKTIKVDRTGSATTAAYQLAKLDKNTPSHKNFLWELSNLEEDYNKGEIQVNKETGVVTCRNIMTSTVFCIVAKSKNKGKRELSSLIVTIEAKEKFSKYTIGCKDKTQNNIAETINKTGSAELFLCENGQPYKNKKDIKWSLKRMTPGSEGISIGEDGIVKWNALSVAKQYIFVVEAIINGDQNKKARTIYSLDVVNPYSFSSEKDTFTCVSDQAGSTDTTFTFKNKITASYLPSDLKYNIECDQKDVFSYDKDKKIIKWTDKIAEGHHWIKLIATNDNDSKYASIWISIQAIRTYIVGQENFVLKFNESVSCQYRLISADKIDEKDIKWSLTNDFGGKLQISDDGKLTGTVGWNGTTTIIVKYKNMDFKTVVAFEVQGLDKYKIEGDSVINCSIYKDGTHENPFVVKDPDDKEVNNVSWRLLGAPEGVTINKKGKICWSGDILERTTYNNILVKAYSQDKSIDYGVKSITLNGTIDFADTTWSEVAQYARNGLDAFKNYFGFKNNDEIIGLTKKIKIDSNEYDVRIVSIDHDDKATNTGKAALTFEIVQYMSNSSKGPVTHEWNSDYYINNYKTSDIRRKVHEYTKKIEDQNGFLITTVNKKTVKAFVDHTSPFDKTLETTPEKCYLASHWEVINNQTSCYTIREEEVFDYYRNRTENKDRQKTALNNDSSGGWWLRTPAEWKIDDRSKQAAVASLSWNGKYNVDGYYLHDKGNIVLYFSL